jgi:hypothetical protein
MTGEEGESGVQKVLDEKSNAINDYDVACALITSQKISAEKREAHAATLLQAATNTVSSETPQERAPRKKKQQAEDSSHIPQVLATLKEFQEKQAARWEVLQSLAESAQKTQENVNTALVTMTTALQRLANGNN